MLYGGFYGLIGKSVKSFCFLPFTEQSEVNCIDVNPSLVLEGVLDQHLRLRIKISFMLIEKKQDVTNDVIRRVLKKEKPLKIRKHSEKGT